MKGNGKSNETIWIRIWYVIYPILIYYFVSNLVMSLLVTAWQMTGGFDENMYVRYYTLLQGLATVVVLPIVYNFFRKDRLLCTVFQQRMERDFAETSQNEKILNGILAFAGGALAGATLNNVIAATGLVEVSEGYQNVSRNFYGSSLAIELVVLAILIPVAEEVLYRGVIFGRLSNWLGFLPAALLSSLIFGGLHLNLVQFVYAFLVGFLLAFLLEKTHHLYGSILAHVGANLLAVLRSELGILDWMGKNGVRFWICTGVMAVACGGIVFFFLHRGRESGR